MDIESPAPIFIDVPFQDQSHDNSASDSNDDFIIDESFSEAGQHINDSTVDFEPNDEIGDSNSNVDEIFALKRAEFEELIDEFLASIPTAFPDCEQVNDKSAFICETLGDQINEPLSDQLVIAKPNQKIEILSNVLVAKARPPPTPESSEDYVDYEFLEEAADATVEVSTTQRSTPQPLPLSTPSNTSRKVKSFHFFFLCLTLTRFYLLFPRAENIVAKPERSC